MSEARTDTTQTRPQAAAAVAGARADAGHAGKHRGGAAAVEDLATEAHGRHRRPVQAGDAA
ncbi:hypothetical protein ABZ208_14130 [Streptomyces sp. NPDC006208]|uniref:hypothetical protein n=1 Tax=Streptomyces sp. NPDC006208 TaxID=3156734 RepID=UPI0033BE894D